MITGDRWGLSFPDICLTVEEKPWKKPQPGKLTQPGIEPEPTGCEAMVLPLDRSDGLILLLICDWNIKGWGKIKENLQ